MMLFGAIEGGGTKFMAAVGDATGKIISKVRVETTTPEETLPAVIRFLEQYDLAGIGIGTFGPLDLDQESSTYGFVTNTPKASWKHVNLLGTFQQAFQLPIYLDTDVNAAAYGEFIQGAARDVPSCVYITVGTGIGGGMVIHQQTVKGLVHPEFGHMQVKRHPQDAFKGLCPYHGDCLEGLAAGPALLARWGKRGEELGHEHPAWEIEADYIAQAIVQVVLLLSPHKIILGGGVMKQRQLFPLIHEKVKDLLNGYVAPLAEQERLETYIVPPGLGDEAGLTGALLMAVNKQQLSNS